jgi:hypothetical protein
MCGCSEGRVEVAERFSLSEKAAGADPDPQSSNSSGSDGSNTKSGTGSASVGSKAGVWSRRGSSWGRHTQGKAAAVPRRCERAARPIGCERGWWDEPTQHRGRAATLDTGSTGERRVSRHGCVN